MPYFGDDLYMGTAFVGRSFASSGGPSRMTKGFGPLGRVYVFDVVPAAKAANNICVAQAIAGAGNALINGALAVTGLNLPGGETAGAVLDHDRTLQMASSNAGDTTQTVTITGYDRYGQKLSQVKTLNGTNAVLFTKAFLIVVQVAVSGVMAGNLTVGTHDGIGLPVKISDAGYVDRVGWNNTLANDAGTLVTADATNPATTATTDVRGLYTPSSAPDGSKRLVMELCLTAAHVGPTATRAGLLGVDQNVSA